MKHLESLRGRGRGVSSTAYPRSRVATSDKTLRKFKRERGVSRPLHSRVANIFAFGECFRVAGYSAVTLQVWGFSVSHLNNSAISAVYLRYLQYLQLHAFLDIINANNATLQYSARLIHSGLFQILILKIL